MKAMHDISEFLWKVRTRMRFGELSRSPLQLLHFELRGTRARCEWLSRQPDDWDRELGAAIQDRNAALQAVLDAISLREVLFSAIPDVSEAVFRAYRQRESGDRELIITGLVSRDDACPPRVSSLVMRAKLYGLHFSMQEGLLEPLTTGKEILQFAT